MPSLTKDFLSELQADYTQYPCFIETGTLYGNTIFCMEPYFQNLYTIEFSEKYYINTKNRYHGEKIQFILGDSSVVFEVLLPDIQQDTIFFLDGHWSSGDTGRSKKDCPLVEEITNIANLFLGKAIIIIDDYRLFGKSPATGLAEDWSNIQKDTLLDILKDRITNVYHLDSECAKDDRLIIHIKELTNLVS